jgi:hypothetical protein
MMKRALVLRAACAIVGMAFSVLACSSSNPTLPPGVAPLDSGLGERGLIQHPDALLEGTEAGAFDAGAHDGAGANDTRDAAKDSPLAGDGAETGIDTSPASMVTVTILDPAAVPGADGGVSDPVVVAKSDRLAPTVQVEVQSMGGDPTLDVVTQVKASIVSVSTKSTNQTISLNQTQYSVVPESGSKVYVYADTPFDLSSVPGDFYDLQVVAVTAGGAVGTATLRIYIDGGPVITFLQPSDGAYVKGSVVVTAMVVDSRSSVTGVIFSIGQYAIDPSAVATNGTQYSTTIDFGSFNPPLDGAQIVTVTATNGNGNTSIATSKFTIDNIGPTISNTVPATGVLIGKLISIEAKVDDPAGVMDSSVIAVVANGDVHFEVNLVKGSDGIYRQLFDTTQLPSFAIYPSVSFRAQDVLGNESSVGYLVSLDNTPPILDLDPPAHFRVVKTDGTCSWPFDPVGPDAVDDGSIVTQLFDIRARVEDRGNTPLTGPADFIPIAAVDPASVKILILEDTSQPLVVDTSDPPDGFCDDINPNLVPSVSPQSSKDAQLIDMVSLPYNAGSPDYTHEPGSACSGTDSSSPKALCDSTYSVLKGQAMTYSLAYAVQLSLPSIWTIPPIVSDGIQCAGRQFDASNNLHDGWACVAVEASDKLGNKQVSRPIRICVVATPGSTACTTAATGGADVASVTLPSTPSGNVVVTTKVPVMGRASAAVVQGDSLVFSQVSPVAVFSQDSPVAVAPQVSPVAVASINGDHTVNPQGTTGTQFILTDLRVAPAELWVRSDDPDAGALVQVKGANYVSKGTVGFVFQGGAEIQVTGTGLDGILGPVFLLRNETRPTDGDQPWSIDNVQATGFGLAGTKVTLSGFATAASMLPDCTGTVVKQTSGSTVDGTKPCKPWSSFPLYEELLLK